MTGDSARTRLAIDLTGPVEFQVFRLTTPDRVVVDLTNVEFTMPPEVGRAGAGLVRSFRFGAFAPGKSRVVIETTGPVKVEATRLLREGARGRHRLEVELVPSATVELTEGEVAAAIESVARLKHGDDGNAHAAPPPSRAKNTDDRHRSGPRRCRHGRGGGVGFGEGHRARRRARTQS